MRLLSLFAAALLPGASAIAIPPVNVPPDRQAQPAPLQQHGFLPSNDCPRPASQFAGKGGIWRGNPAEPRKLTELSPADAYAAMLQTDERGCMVMVKYRDLRP